MSNRIARGRLAGGTPSPARGYRRTRAAFLALTVFLAASCSSADSREPEPVPNVTSILVEKSDRRMHLLAGGRIVRTYRIALGSSPVGPKRTEGDGKTPEGRYLIDGRNPRSSFHRALHVSYPSPADVERARALGKPPGGDIMIHGIRNGLGWIGRLHRVTDWTQGCVAVTDAEIEELWVSVADGTPIEIRP